MQCYQDPGPRASGPSVKNGFYRGGMGVEVTERTDRNRFEIIVDGAMAGFAEYRPVRDNPLVLRLFHTEIDPSRQGRGLGSELVGRMLAQLRARKVQVLPGCWFVRSYLVEHPEYVELVPDADRERYGLGSAAATQDEVWPVCEMPSRDVR
jgi:uncharacterized protein